MTWSSPEPLPQKSASKLSSLNRHGTRCSQALTPAGSTSSSIKSQASAARRAKYDFSVPYTYDHTAILVRSDNNDIKGFDDLRGKRAAESATANSSRIAEAHGAVIVGVQDFSQAVELVVSKRADTALNSELSIADFMRKMPDVPVKVVATSTEAEEMCVLMPKGSQALKAAIDEAIESLRADGTLSKLSKQFLGRDVAVK